MVDNGTFPTLAGTEGTSEYTSLLVSDHGILAVRRDTRRGVYRLRVEPTTAKSATKLAKTLLPGVWKQPGDGGQNRFSEVCSLSDSAALAKLVSTAAGALLDGSQGLVSPGAPAELSELLTGLGATVAGDQTVQHPRDEHAALVTKAQGAKLPGANAAKGWRLSTLRDATS